MLRIAELKLPLDHPEPALRQAVLSRLGIAEDELIDFTVFKRSYDARKRSAIVLIYALDVQVKNEAQVLQRLQHDRQVMPSPDTGYKFVTNARPAPGTPRPPGECPPSGVRCPHRPPCMARSFGIRCPACREGVRHVALIQHPTNSRQIVCMHHEWAFFFELLQMPIHMMRCNKYNARCIDTYARVFI